VANLIEFADTVTAEHLDPNQTHCVYYVDGLYANEAAVRARCPKAKLYGITVEGKTGKDVFACDSETGDLTVAATEAWVAAQIGLDVDPCCVYADLDRWENQGLLGALAKYGSRIKRWVADYNNVAIVPGGYDAHQYSGGITDAVDKNVALETFFSPSKPPAPVDPHHYLWFDDAPVKLPHGENSERNVVKNYDEQRLHPVKNKASLLLIKENLAELALRLDKILIADPADIDHRPWRRDQMQARADGVQFVK
jgi:hypothetical protein